MTLPVTSPTYSRVDNLPFRKFDDETVVLNPSNREMHVLNGTGSRIWELLAIERSVAELIRVLETDGRFEADDAVVAGDIAVFVAELVRKGLVTERGAAYTYSAAPMPARIP
jgi:hypothetical protein